MSIGWPCAFCDVRQSFGVQNKQTLEGLRLRGLLVSFHISVLVQLGEIISGGKRSSVRGCGETGRMQLSCLSFLLKAGCQAVPARMCAVFPSKSCIVFQLNWFG